MNSIHTQLEKAEMMEAQARLKVFVNCMTLGADQNGEKKTARNVIAAPYVQVSMQHTDFISNIC